MDSWVGKVPFLICSLDLGSYVSDNSGVPPKDLDEPRITLFNLAYSFITFMAVFTLRVNTNVTPQAVLL
jgi:hypothetical protein